MTSFNSYDPCMMAVAPKCVNVTAEVFLGCHKASSQRTQRLMYSLVHLYWPTLVSNYSNFLRYSKISWTSCGSNQGVANFRVSLQKYVIAAPLYRLESNGVWSIMESRLSYEQRNSICHQQKTLTHQVFVLKKKWPQCSVLPTETSVNFPREYSRPPHERQLCDVQFTNGDFVIMLFRAKKVTLSLSRIVGGSGSQSQHIITASIWL